MVYVWCVLLFCWRGFAVIVCTLVKCVGVCVCDVFCVVVWFVCVFVFCVVGCDCVCRLLPPLFNMFVWFVSVVLCAGVWFVLCAVFCSLFLR